MEEFNGFRASLLPEFQWMELHRLEFEFDSVLQALKESIRFNDQLISNKHEGIERSAKEDSYLSSDAEKRSKSQYYGHTYGELGAALLELNDVLLNSGLLSLFAIFEGKLKELCKLIENEIGSNITHSDLKGDGDLGQIMKYFILVFGMDSKNIDQELILIKQHRFLRNKIAHTNGYISPKNSSTYKGNKSLRVIEYSNEEHEIQITSSNYLMDLIKLMEDFFEKLLKEVDLRMHQIKTK